jgi:2-dehydropantoate 2-reductase
MKSSLFESAAIAFELDGTGVAREPALGRGTRQAYGQNELTMRYVIYGAGAIGATIGGKLHQAGCEVVLIARGAQREALEGQGLRLQTPDADDVLRIPVAGAPGEIEYGPQDVVVLAVKSQDSASALDELAAAAGSEVALACAQNGVDNERMALRRFAASYGLLVYVPAQFLEPGLVQVFMAPVHGVLDVGRLPGGADERAEAVAADLGRAGFDSRSNEGIMRFKYAKLLDNLGNALDALLGSRDAATDLVARAREEALRCYEAAGIDFASEEEMRERLSAMPAMRPVAGIEHEGSSSSQSLVRGTGTSEADYLNGEIALLGREHGVPTPVNDVLQRLAGAAARDRRPPGSMTAAEIETALG